MRELLMVGFSVVCIVCSQESHGQSVTLEYLSDKCYPPETMLFNVTVNLTDATFNTTLYTLELYAYMRKVCVIHTINGSGCFNESQPYCGYCVQQEDDTYFISFEISRQHLLNNNNYYYNTNSAYCRLIIYNDYYNTRWSNVIRLPLFYTGQYGYENLMFDFAYEFVDKKFPTTLNATFITLYVNFWYYWYHLYSNTTLVIGKDIINLENYNMHYTNGFNLSLKTQNEIAVFEEGDGCSYICDSLDISDDFLSLEYYEEGDLTNLTLHLRPAGYLVVRGMSFEQQGQYYYLSWKTSDDKKTYLASYRDFNLSLSNLVFHVTYGYNTSFCRPNYNLGETAIPIAHISDCPKGEGVKNGFIRRSTTVTCTCQMVRRFYAFGYVQWFTSDGQSESLPGETSVLAIYSNTTETNISYNCLGISRQGNASVGTFVAEFYDIPKVVKFIVNGSKSVAANVNNSVSFYCLVEAEPPAVAVLTGSGLGKVKVNTSASDVLEITINDLQCEDSGRYFCRGRNGFEDNDTSSKEYVDVNITCAPKLKNAPDKIPTIQASPNENTVFTLEVYGYPEPTGFGLKIETGRSTSAVDNNKYSVTYLPLTPPFGLVTLTIYDANTHGTTTYILSIRSEAGEVEMKLEVVKDQQPVIVENNSDKSFAIFVSVACLVLVLCTIIAVCVHVRKRPRSKESNHAGNTTNTEQTTNNPGSSSDLFEIRPTFQPFATPLKGRKTAESQSHYKNYIHIKSKRYQYPEEPPPDYPTD